MYSAEQIEQVKQAVQRATESWQGLEWDSDLQDIDACVAEGSWTNLSRAKSIAEDRGGHLVNWFPEDGSFESQNRRKSILNLGYALMDGEADAEDAAALALAEREHVEEVAAEAASYGQTVLTLLAEGAGEDALEYARDAANLERIYGDAPSWGPVVTAVEGIVSAHG